MATTRMYVLGCPVDLLDMDGAVARVVELVEEVRAGSRESALVATLNPEMVMAARRDAGFAAVLRAADISVADGIGVVRAVRERGGRVQRVTGVDLLSAYLPVAAQRGHRVAFCGAAPGVATAAAEIVRARVPGIDIVVDEGDPTPATAERLAKARPHLVAAAYGAGVQELFLAAHAQKLGAVGIGVGGTLDYLAGKATRAPAPLRSAGLEWAWRLMLEPRRIKRQLVLPRFWWEQRREVRSGNHGAVG